MVHVDLNPYRAHLIKNPTEPSFTTTRHRRARPQDVRCDGDAPDADLGKRLVAMPQCTLVDSLEWCCNDRGLSYSDDVSGVCKTATVTNHQCCAAVSPAFALVQYIGIEPSSWATANGPERINEHRVIGGEESTSPVAQDRRLILPGAP